MKLAAEICLVLAGSAPASAADPVYCELALLTSKPTIENLDSARSLVMNELIIGKEPSEFDEDLRRHITGVWQGLSRIQVGDPSRHPVEAVLLHASGLNTASAELQEMCD
jgi:hypothetical protein